MTRLRKRMNHYRVVEGYPQDRYVATERSYMPLVDGYVVDEVIPDEENAVVVEGDTSTHHKKKKLEANAVSNTNISPEYHGHLHVAEKEKNSMNDIAGLMALMQGAMQGKSNVDIAGLMALCKEKGYDRSFGGEGAFMFMFFLLFLLFGGGWGGIGRNNQGTMEAMVGAQTCQDIIGLHDRISAAQSVSTNGFQSLQTWLCQAIDAVNASTRDQGDRVYGAVRNVGDAIRDCCCNLEARLTAVGCDINNLARSVSDVNANLSAKIELEQLKAENAREKMECRLLQGQKDLMCDMNARFDQLNTTIATNRLQDENTYLARKLQKAEDALRGKFIADQTLASMQNFMIQHYTPTAGTTTTTTTTGGGAA